MYKPIKFICWVLIGILFFSMSALPSLARDVNVPKFPLSEPQQQQPTEPKQPVITSPTAPGLSNPQEFEGFVDKIINEEISKSHIPGVAISVVKDGKPFFSQGYGYANVEKKIPVVIDKTLFRVASLSKLFTATAAMQLYEPLQRETCVWCTWRCSSITLPIIDNYRSSSCINFVYWISLGK